MQILVSAGNNIEAKLIEEVGFGGIWVSGFEACCRLGMPDNGTITLGQMLSIVEPIKRATKLPIYVDCDTGYADFITTAMAMNDIGVKGICVEDVVQSFKQNSLWGDKVPLLEAEAFGDKIAQAVGKTNGELEIIGRTEAYVRGYGEEECWKRLKTYYEAGATWLLPHSRTRPLTVPEQKDYYAIVPTKFPNFHKHTLHEMGYSMIIWANQTCRVQIKAVRDMLRHLKIDGCMRRVDEELCATLDDMKGFCGD